jgi:hypothetical protein
MQAGKKLAPRAVTIKGKECVLEGMLLTAWDGKLSNFQLRPIGTKRIFTIHYSTMQGRTWTYIFSGAKKFSGY